MLDVSVIIPARDEERTIGAQLDALAGQRTRRHIEVIVVDNGSSDGTSAVIRSRMTSGLDLRVVDGAGCTGAAAVRNLGASVATAPIVMFCDADDAVDVGWVEAIAVAIEDGGLDIAAGVLELDELNPGDLVSWRDVATRPHWHGVPYGLSCNMGIRIEAFERLEGFSEAFPGAAGEDIDLFVRAHLLGLRVDYVDAAVVHYRLRDSVWALLRQQYGYGVANVALRHRHAAALGLPRSLGGPRQLLGAAVRAGSAMLRRDRAGVIRNLGVAAMCSGRIRASVATEGRNT